MEDGVNTPVELKEPTPESGQCAKDLPDAVILADGFIRVGKNADGRTDLSSVIDGEVLATIHLSQNAAHQVAEWLLNYAALPTPARGDDGGEG